MKTTEELKTIYRTNPDKWIVIVQHKNNKWYIHEYPNSLDFDHWKLISIKHKNILDSYLADNRVEIEYLKTYGASKRMWVKVNFIEEYNPELEYKLKEKEDGDSDMCINDSTNMDDDLLQLNNFQDFGFTGDFEGEILREVDGKYIGWLKNHLGSTFSAQWIKDGKIMPQAYNTESYNLTPITEKFKLATKEELLSLYVEGERKMDILNPILLWITIPTLALFLIHIN